MENGERMSVTVEIMGKSDDEAIVNRDQRTCRSPSQGIRIIPSTAVDNILTDNLHIPPVFTPVTLRVVRIDVKVYYWKTGFLFLVVGVIPTRWSIFTRDKVNFYRGTKVVELKMANYDIRRKIIFCSDTYSNNNNHSTVAYDVGKYCSYSCRCHPLS